jgi:transmembrane sensor
MPESLSSELLARYLAGEASPAEQAEVEAWAAASEEHRAELDRLREAWAATGQPATWDVDSAWRRVAARLDEPTVIPLPSGRRRVLLALAASLAVVVGAALVWQVTRTSRQEYPRAVSTAIGERSTVELSDGTRITLAPLTELRVQASYGRAERRVELSGEAWFQVVHDAARPFRVVAQGTVIEDLGTEFTVRAIPGSGLVRVAVVSGRASLRRDGAREESAVILDAADVAVLRDADSVPQVERRTVLAPHVSWREGRLSFDDIPLDSLAGELSRWFPVRFLVADPAAARLRFSGPLPLDRLGEALDIVAAALSLRIARTGDTVVFRRIE